MRNHQEQNASEFEKNIAAVVITEAELSKDVLFNKITDLLNDKEKLNTMAQNVGAMAKVDALEKIYELMIKMSK